MTINLSKFYCSKVLILSRDKINLQKQNKKRVEICIEVNNIYNRCMKLKEHLFLYR